MSDLNYNESFCSVWFCYVLTELSSPLIRYRDEAVGGAMDNLMDSLDSCSFISGICIPFTSKFDDFLWVIGNLSTE
jgi:hypothetical protein